jgi:hypothetical protein
VSNFRFYNLAGSTRGDPQARTVFCADNPHASSPVRQAVARVEQASKRRDADSMAFGSRPCPRSRRLRSNSCTT